MRFDHSDAFRGYSGAIIGVQQSFFLSRGAGSVDRVTFAVTGRADSADDRIDFVSVALGIGQTLDDDDAESFAENCSVCR